MICDIFLKSSINVFSPKFSAVYKYIGRRYNNNRLKSQM